MAENGIRQRPILPGRVQPSTFGAEGLNFCVRYGNRWDPFAIATGNYIILFRTLTTALRKNIHLSDLLSLIRALEIKPSTY